MNTLLLTLALLPAHADDIDYPVLGTPVVTNLATDGEVDTFTFDATPGQVVLIQITGAGNRNNQSWELLDRWDRVISAETTRLQSSDPIALMGGQYRWQATGDSGNYTVTIWDVPTVESNVAIGVPFSGSIDSPRANHWHHFNVPTDQIIYMDTVGDSGGASLEWTLEDVMGNIMTSNTSRIADSDRIALKAGDYTFKVTSEVEGTGSYDYVINEVVDEFATTTVGATFTGAIDHPGQHDVWSFAATPGQCIGIDQIASSNKNRLGWELQDPRGNTIASNTGSLTDSGPYCLLSGDYTLTLQSENSTPDAQGTYEMRVAEVLDTDATIVVDQVVSGSIDAPGEVGRYTFTATAGQQFHFDVLAGTTSSNSLNYRIDHIDGRQVQDWTTNLNWSSPVPLTAGQHVVTVRGENEYLGPYEFRIVDPTYTSVATSIGSTLTGAVVDAGDRTTYSFSAAAGQGIDLELVSSSNSSELNYWLRDQTGTTVFGPTSTLNSVGPIYLVGGDYTLQILPEDDEVGDWVVNLNANGTSAWVPTGIPLTLDSPNFALTVPANDSVDYIMSLGSDEQLFFDSLGGDDLDWELIDPTGRTLFNSRLRHDYDDEGPYDLLAGDYTLKIVNISGAARDANFEVVTVSNTSALYTIGDVVTGTAITRGGSASYTFDVATTRSLFFDLQDGIDQDWILTDPVGVEVFRTEAKFNTFDDIGPLIVTPGTWTLTFIGQQDEVADFSFQIVEPQPQSFITSIDTLQIHSSVVQGDVYTYFFDADGDELVYFDIVDNNGIDGDWRLYDPAGQRIFSSGAQFDFEDQGPLPLTAGTWRLELDPDNHEIDSWIIDIAESVPRSFFTSLDTPESSTFATKGGYDTYDFTLATDGAIYVAMTGSGTEANWRLLDHLGHVYASESSIFTDISDEGHLDLTAGDYSIQFRPESGDLLDYGFIAHEVLPQSVLADYNTPLSGQILTAGAHNQHHFTIVEDGRQVLIDLLTGDLDLNWSLIDEVGEPVYPFSGAFFEETNDRGIYRLAAGDYHVELSGDHSSEPPYEFRVLADIDSREFYYTRNDGNGTLKRQQWTYDGTSLVTALRFDVADLPAADGLVFTPGNELVVGGRGNGFYTNDGIHDSWSQFETNAGNAYHPSLAPSGNTVWFGGEPDQLVEVSASPVNDGLPTPVTGDDTSITQLMWDRDGRTWYTRSSSSGIGSFGIIDMATKTTTRHLGPSFPAHTMSYDIFSETLFIVGDDTITQWDTQTATVLGQLSIPGERFDGATVDGRGHLLLPSSTDRLWVVDYTASARIDDPSTTTHSSFLHEDFDSIAPLSWLGSGCLGEHALAELEPVATSDVPEGQRLILGRVLVPTPTRPVSNISVGGVPAVGPDAAGTFWALVDVQPGLNTLDVDVVDRCGTQTIPYSVNGVDGDTVSNVVDLTELAVIDMHGTTWGSDGTTLVTDVDVTNDSNFAWRGPLWLAVGPDLAPTIQLTNPDGVHEGLPYAIMADENAYVPGGVMVPQFTWVFDNPLRVKPGFTPRLYGPANNPPVFVSPPSLVLNTGEAWSYQPEVYDPDSDPIIYTLLRSPNGVSINPTNGELTWLPTAADAGLHAFELQADDGRGGTTSQSWVLLVGSGFTNRAPVFTSRTVVEGNEGQFYTYDSHAVDPDGNGVVYSLTGPPGMTVGNTDGIVRWPSPVAGLHDVELTANDGQGGTSSQTWQLAIGEPPPNQAPIITSRPREVAVQGRPYVYSARGVDPDGEPGDPALIWNVVGPAGMTVDGTGRITWSPSLADVGSHAVTVQVTDFELATGTQTYTVQVNAGPPNLPPVFETTPEDRGILSKAWRYSPYATDPEAGLITYDFVSGPTGMTWDLSRRLLLWDIPDLIGGTHPVVFTATDPAGNVTTQAWDLFIRTTNDAPFFDPATPPDAVANAAWQFDTDATDPDDDELTYKIISGPGTMTIDSLTGLLFWIPGAADVGTATVTVRATDEYDAFAEATYTFTVGTDTTPPQVVLDAPDTGCVGGALEVCVLASDDVGLASRSLTINGVVQTLDTFSCATISTNTLGTLNLVATAIDVGGNASTDTTSVSIDACP